jgi:hypothetical protein
MKLQHKIVYSFFLSVGGFLLSGCGDQKNESADHASFSGEQTESPIAQSDWLPEESPATVVDEPKSVDTPPLIGSDGPPITPEEIRTLVMRNWSADSPFSLSVIDSDFAKLGDEGTVTFFVEIHANEPVAEVINLGGLRSTQCFTPNWRKGEFFDDNEGRQGLLERRFFLV